MTTPTTPVPARYLSVHDLAARWGEHPNTVYLRVRATEWLDAVRTIQLGRQLRFLEADVDAFEEARRLSAAAIAAALVDESSDDPGEPGAASGEPVEPIEAQEPPATEFGPRRPPVGRKAAA